MNDVIINLTAEQAEFLLKLRWNTDDAGPANGGWASAELNELCGIVDNAIVLAFEKRVR